MDSILQRRKECYLCRLWFNRSEVKHLECHHIFGGVGRRKLSEQYGLKVWLCHKHHNEPPFGAHFSAATMGVLERAGQTAFERSGHSREEFMRKFGKNYLDLEIKEVN